MKRLSFLTLLASTPLAGMVKADEKITISKFEFNRLPNSLHGVVYVQFTNGGIIRLEEKFTMREYEEIACKFIKDEWVLEQTKMNRGWIQRHVFYIQGQNGYITSGKQNHFIS